MADSPRTSRINDHTFSFSTRKIDDGTHVVEIDGVFSGARVQEIEAATFRVIVHERSAVVWVVQTASGWLASIDGQTIRGVISAHTDRNRTEPRDDAYEHSLRAPMPARVVQVTVAVGEQVAQGETLVVLEAMKMQFQVNAPAMATVSAVHCREGELVAMDAVLIELR